MEKTLNPIKLPELIPASHPYSDVIKAIGLPAETDESTNTYIWDSQESRLWFFGQREAYVLYFSFEYGKPFAFYRDSLLITRKGNSLDWDKLAFHLMTSLQYPIAASNELLPANGPYPAILGELVKKKLLPVKAEKFARHVFDQYCMEKLGFKQPTLSRYDVLGVLVEATCDYSISAVARIHPLLYSMISVPGIVSQKHETKPITPKDSTEEQIDFIENEKAEAGQQQEKEGEQ